MMMIPKFIIFYPDLPGEFPTHVFKCVMTSLIDQNRSEGCLRPAMNSLYNFHQQRCDHLEADHITSIY